MDRRPISHSRLIFALAFCASLVILPGCSSFSLFGRDPEDERIEAMSDTSDVQGPLERMIAWTKKTDHEELRRDPRYYELGRDEYKRAEQIYEKRDWETAEDELKRIVKKYEDYAVKEDALFLLGELYYQTKRYPEATDAFAELSNDFPSTRHQRKVSSRMFTIAGIWLDFPDVVSTTDIQLASNLDKATKMSVPEHKRDSWDPTLAVPFLPNFHDSTRPAFDTEGRALEALKSIWLNDPTSELADDALMMTASHYLREGDSVRADEYFAALRQNYPDSPHFKDSFILGSHVKLMSYEGTSYDGTRLEESKQLKESALRMWPDSELRGRLKKELEVIEEAKAKREWARVEFYNKKNRPDSAAIYCREILRLYPDTKYAESARQFLATNEISSPEAKSKSSPRNWNWSLFPRLEKVPEEADGSSEGSSSDENSDPPPSASPNPTPTQDRPYDETGRVKL
ncbi:MAG: outer membrane protein assembly factor BamD [Planctomycetaceae bacterium]|nr:outer membrane protein assembly factor BamD [Planctomycetaceae bacterium]